MEVVIVLGCVLLFVAALMWLLILIEYGFQPPPQPLIYRWTVIFRRDDGSEFTKLFWGYDEKQVLGVADCFINLSGEPHTVVSARISRDTYI